VTIIVDTGPLVAVMNRRDKYHGWASEHFARLAPPLVTCEGVISEASFLLDHDSAPVELIERGVVRIALQCQDEASRLRALMTRYASVPMAFADACLVRLSELHTDCLVWTVDSDFRIYRRNGRQRIPTLMPPDV
jgi:predicted nucleic acid-binding protein